MKNLIFILTLILSLNVCAQNTSFEDTNVFVRVYDAQGKKINKGHIVSISDTSLQLVKRGETIDVPINDIGSIKTKYSGWTNVVTGAVLGAGVGFIAGDPEVIAIGTVAGAAAGWITTLFKKTETFDIDGDAAKLEALESLLVE
ncbi:hypothetical protein [Formosa algae]|uniref:Outer membrane lipoprotein SlyB n=1 Tax=Formosa algae TaxID=225843 RepID=A0A9X1CAV6_9FLAO|nr:hypothetical protein [Formosa algae]MBP1839402.1 outer membrane lipoprotein SlyB [Formosa algae]MDQ0334706.1 outer membrane lipoprotein SlyB [Formosa algae]